MAARRSEYLDAEDAARVLGITRATLYAYVSRGKLRSVSGGAGRARRYLRTDVERLRARSLARAGHGAVAAGALRWGEPVLESSISAIDAAGPRYRGILAVDLAARGTTFEAVAELLWTGALPEPTPTWRACATALPFAELVRLIPAGSAPLSVLGLVLPALALGDPERFSAPDDAERERARRVLRLLAASLELANCERTVRRLQSALSAPSVASSLLTVWQRSDTAWATLLDRALILVADHELNASTFAARVAASAGGDLYACSTAALAALSGPRHGGACSRIEALLDECGEPRRARRTLLERARRGESIPGFGHPLYPAGDPRATPLLDAAQHAGASRELEIVLAVVEAMRDLGREPPTVDLALVAVAAALGLPRGSATSIFAIGRVAGWVAHGLEQRAAGYLLRPRARYVGSDALG